MFSDGVLKRVLHMDVAFGRHQVASAGPCSIDLDAEYGNVPNFVRRDTKSDLVVERMITDADDGMHAHGPNDRIPFHYSVPEGYMFDI
jgi:hypothetical protein